jgi:hypothetical protein
VNNRTGLAADQETRLLPRRRYASLSDTISDTRTDWTTPRIPTPGEINPSVAPGNAYYRSVAEVDQFVQFHFTKTNAFTGDNGRAADPERFQRREFCPHGRLRRHKTPRPVPTVTMRVLFVFIVLEHSRREVRIDAGRLDCRAKSSEGDYRQ